MTDGLGLSFAVLYVFGVIALGEGLRRWRGYGNTFTRKVIHIGVGMMSWFVPFWFSSPWPFVIVALIFAGLLFLDWRYQFVASMASSDEANLGTVYFPLAAAAVTLLFWEQPPLLVGALMPLTWGDGLASVVGRTFGRHSYHVFGHRRSLEGSLAFLVAGGTFTWLALWLMPGSPDLTPWTALLPALAAILLAGVVEAISLFGLDNLTVTAVATGLFWFWPWP